jgi:hypothetical protein
MIKEIASKGENQNMTIQRMLNTVKSAISGTGLSGNVY